MLGACIGEVIAGKELGKRALLLGAIAQSVPDIDIVAGLWNDMAGDLLAHRGFTHSLLFAILFTTVFSAIAKRVYHARGMSYRHWVVFFGAELACHLFLDLFNSYGTGLLEPFSHARFSLNAIFVADPLLTIWPLAASIVILFVKKRRKTFAWASICLSGLYLLSCVLNKIMVERAVHSSLALQRISYDRCLITPAPLTNLLWFVAAESPTGYYAGYRSVFDKKQTMDLHFFPKNDALLAPVRDSAEVRKLVRFSQGYYIVENANGQLVFSDLRFGQRGGWQNPSSPFVFRFFINDSTNSGMMLQRGRMAGWGKNSLNALVRRIKGN